MGLSHFRDGQIVVFGRYFSTRRGECHPDKVLARAGPLSAPRPRIAWPYCSRRLYFDAHVVYMKPITPVDVLRG